MPKNDPLVKIQNVVATAALNHEIDLNAVVKTFPEAEYRPKKFPGVIFRIERPKTATLIFGSGKMVCTGATSDIMAKNALKKVVRKLKQSGIIILGKPIIKIVNVVATSDLGGIVDLVDFYESESSMGGRIIYEPEQFPGLIYRINKPKAVILLFSSGKMVCTGTKNEEETCQAVKEISRRVKDEGMIMQVTARKKNE